MPYSRRWTPTYVAAAVAAVLLLWMPAVAENETMQEFLEHRCIFDELQERVTPSGTSQLVQLAPSNTSARATNATAAAAGTYAPIRIGVFSDDLNDPLRYCTEVGQIRSNFQGGTQPCTEPEILTDAKKSKLLGYIIPKAVELHQERLQVGTVIGNVITSAMDTKDYCNQFTVPASHSTTGVENADFVLYVSAGPTSENVIAWAMPCLYLQNGRPVVGVSNFSPTYISETSQVARTMSHELLHAMGFNFNTFAAARMTSSISSLREKPDNSYVVSSLKVVEAAKLHYGCPSLTFMELEDEGGGGTALSHWKRRNARDDLMAGISSQMAYYTAMTIAAMEDLGYYKGNYDKAEVMPWGRDAGCGIATEKCVKDGVSLFPSMFCAERIPGLECEPGRAAMGYCNIQTYASALPSHFQYFSDPLLGGVRDALTDYCPTITTYANTQCIDGDVDLMHGSVVGKNARCFSPADDIVYVGGVTPRSVNALCVDVSCGECSYSVKVKGSSSYVTCTPGTTLSLTELSSEFSSGSLMCPPQSEVCLEYKNPFASQGRSSGTCDLATSSTAAPSVSPTKPVNVCGSVWSTTIAVLATAVALLCLLAMH